MALTEFRQLLSKKTLETRDVMHCFLGLRNLEIEVYFYLLQGTATVKEIAEGLGRNRSTVQRAVQNLVHRGFAHHRSRTLRKGGYTYVYEAVDLATVKDLIKQTLDSFYSQIVTFLDQRISLTK